MKLGEVVYSKAGRDSGRYYAVVEVISSDYVRIADGDLRRIRSAKLKKVKHLRSTEDILPKIAEKLENGGQVFDAELKAALRFFGDKQ